MTDLFELAKKQRQDVLDKKKVVVETDDIFGDSPAKTTTKKKPTTKKPAKKKPTPKKEEVETIAKKEEVEPIIIKGGIPKKGDLLAIREKPKTTQYPIQTLPTREDIDRHLEMYNYVKKKIVDRTDFVLIKGKNFLKKSGVKKFVNAFNITVECVEERVYELDGDLHAEYRIKATLPNGQFVENVGICSKSELEAKKNYSLHNLKATAWTRASNRAILDLVAFGEVSAEEIMRSGKKDADDIF